MARYRRDWWYPRAPAAGKIVELLEAAGAPNPKAPQLTRRNHAKTPPDSRPRARHPARGHRELPRRGRSEPPPPALDGRNPAALGPQVAVMRTGCGRCCPSAPTRTATDDAGNTPLHRAAVWGITARGRWLVVLLLAAGADAGRKNKRGVLPFPPRETGLVPKPAETLIYRGC